MFDSATILFTAATSCQATATQSCHTQPVLLLINAIVTSVMAAKQLAHAPDKDDHSRMQHSLLRSLLNFVRCVCAASLLLPLLQ